MNYITVDSAEWMYPDITAYSTASHSASLTALRGGFASFQIMLTDAPAEGVTVTANADAPCEICLYRLKSVRVEGNPGFDGKPLTNGTEGFNSPDMDGTDGDRIPSQPCRVAPYRVYDCICPLGDAHSTVYSSEPSLRPLKPTHTGAAENGGIISLYVTLRFADAGELGVSLQAGDAVIPVTVTVLDAPTPAERLKIAVGYFPGILEKYHGVGPGSPELQSLDEKYLAVMRRSRQTVLYVDNPPSRRTNGKWEFDFRPLERRVTLAMEMGFQFFFIYGIGFRKSWSEETIIVNGMDSESAEGVEYTESYLKALREFLAGKGWLHRFAMGVADEPNAINIDRYVSLSRRMKRAFPELKLFDAVSYLPRLEGVLDICIPREDELEAHRGEFEGIASHGAELWHYVCLFPRGHGYINRFLDMPLLATRYLFWGCFADKLSGFLHWSVNCWMEGQDPFECNCPAHVNAGSSSTLPPGDSHSVYPGDGEPWMSMRLEAQRQGAEEYEMLRTVAETDENEARRLCGDCFIDFSHVEYDVKKVGQARRALMEAYTAAVRASDGKSQ